MGSIGFAHYTNYRSGIHHRAVDVMETCNRDNDTRRYYVSVHGRNNDVLRQEIIENPEGYFGDHCGRTAARKARELGKKWAKEFGCS